MTFFDKAKSLVKKMVQTTENELNEIDDWINHVQFPHEGFDLTYNVNEDGFRSDSFEGENGIVFLGCSLTYGYGLEEWEVWPWIVGKHFQSKVRSEYLKLVEKEPKRVILVDGNQLKEEIHSIIWNKILNQNIL